jgi:hypothetical protein
MELFYMKLIGKRCNMYMKENDQGGGEWRKRWKGKGKEFCSHERGYAYTEIPSLGEVWIVYPEEGNMIFSQRPPLPPSYGL